MRGMGHMDNLSNSEKRAAQRYAALVKGAGIALEELQALAQSRDTPDGVRLTEVRVRIGQTYGSEVLLIIKGRAGARPVVGFHSGPDMVSAFTGAVARLRDATLRWKVDEWQVAKEEAQE